MKITSFKRPDMVFSYMDQGFYDPNKIVVYSLIVNNEGFPGFKHNKGANTTYFDGHSDCLKYGTIPQRSAPGVYPWMD